MKPFIRQLKEHSMQTQNRTRNWFSLARVSRAAFIAATLAAGIVFPTAAAAAHAAPAAAGRALYVEDNDLYKLLLHRVSVIPVETGEGMLPAGDISATFTNKSGKDIESIEFWVHIGGCQDDFLYCTTNFHGSYSPMKLTDHIKAGQTTKIDGGSLLRNPRQLIDIERANAGKQPVKLNVVEIKYTDGGFERNAYGIRSVADTRAGEAGSAVPSSAYAAKALRRVRPNIVWSGGSVEGETVLSVHCAPTGTLLSVQVARSSGNSVWDDAVLRAVKRSDPMPADIDGKAPSSFTITLRPD